MCADGEIVDRCVLRGSPGAVGVEDRAAVSALDVDHNGPGPRRTGAGPCDAGILGQRGLLVPARVIVIGPAGRRFTVG